MGMLIVDDEEFEDQVINTDVSRTFTPKRNTKDKESDNKDESDSEQPTRALDEEELNQLTTGTIQDINRGRGIGSVEVPSVLRRVIGEEALLGNNKETALAFGVSESSVSAYKHGANSTASYNKHEDSLTPHISNIKERVRTKANRRLIAALNQITPEKLADANLKTVASVARDMSSIVKNMEEPQERSEGTRVQFVMYAPRVRNESEFEIREVIDA